MALTAKQELFCRLMSEGKRQSEAYKMAYNCEKMLPATIDNNAYMLSKKSEIVARIKELQEELQQKSQLTVEKLLQELDEIEELAKQPIHGKNQSDYDLTNWIKIKAEKAKLLGLYAPVKTDTKVTDTDKTALTEAYNRLTKALENQDKNK
jgi:phage terminase small subunit